MPKQRNVVLEALLTEYGYSHQQLADEVNDVAGLLLGKPAACTDRHVRRWISGEVTWPWNRYLLPLKEIFGRPPEALGFIPRGRTSARLPEPPPRPTPPRTTREPVQRRTFIAASAAATVATALRIDDTPARGRLGMTDVQRIQGTIDRLDGHFNAVGGGPLLEVALLYIDRIRTAIDGCTYATRIEQALHRAISALYSSAGLAARDCAHGDKAALLHAAALQSALIAGDPPGQARAWADLAVQARSEKRHREAVQITRAALDNRQIRHAPRIAALLHARHAIGQARIGDHPGVGRSLLAAERAYDRVGDDSPPPWLAVVAEAELSGLAGIAHKALGQYARAEQATTQALDLMAPSLRRNRTYYTTLLAELQLAQGHREEAAATAAAIDTAAIDSQLVTTWLATVNHTLGGDHA